MSHDASLMFTVRIFLHCAFYTTTTWDALNEALGYIPRWSTFEADLPIYESTLHRLSTLERRPIYTSGFQLVPPTPYFGGPHFAASLRFVLALMRMNLPSQLLECHLACDASYMLRTVPTLGGFLSLNMLCYLNESPHLSFSYRNFASCGPGARAFLRVMFGPAINSIAMEEAGLCWLQEHQWDYWATIGVDPPHAWELGIRPGMRVLDFENALCWCHRYAHDYLRLGYGSLADLPDPLTRQYASPPAWCDEELHIKHRSRPVLPDDYDESLIKAQHEGYDGIWEVERIVGRRGGRTDRDGLLRVRWKGYPPEEDTYERVSSVMKGAAEAVASWLAWEEKVWATIATIKEDFVYTTPNPSVRRPKRLRAE